MAGFRKVLQERQRVVPDFFFSFTSNGRKTLSRVVLDCGIGDSEGVRCAAANIVDTYASSIVCRGVVHDARALDDDPDSLCAYSPEYPTCATPTSVHDMISVSSPA